MLHATRPETLSACARLHRRAPLHKQRPSHVTNKVSRRRTPVGLAARASALQTTTVTQRRDAMTSSRVDIDSAFKLDVGAIQSYRRDGFVKIPKVFDEPTLTHYGLAMSLEVKEADKTPLQQDPDYAQAFTQVRIVVAVFSLCSNKPAVSVAALSSEITKHTV